MRRYMQSLAQGLLISDTQIEYIRICSYSEAHSLT